MEVLEKLNDLINDVMYGEKFYCEGHEMPDAQRLFFVESLELIKKTTYLMQGQNYTIPTHILDKKDIGYQLRQLIYMVEHPKNVISIEGVPLGDNQQAFAEGLRVAYQKVAQLNS